MFRIPLFALLLASPAFAQQATSIPSVILPPGSALPAKAMAGQPFRFDLAMGRRGTFEMLEGPKGLTITREGVLTWRPAAEIGMHEFKVKYTFDKDATELHRYRIEVEPLNPALLIRKAPVANGSSGSAFGGRTPPGLDPGPIPFEKLPIIRQFLPKRVPPPTKVEP